MSDIRTNTTGLDEDTVSAWISGLGIGVDLPITFSRIGNGQSNLTYLVADAGGGRWVLRRPPLGTLLASAHDVVREYRILSGLQNTPVPVPKMIALCQDPAVSDVPMVLMSFVDGAVLDHISKAEALSPEQRSRVGLALPSALADIHRVDLESAGLSDLARRGPYAERQLNRWSRQWEASKTRDVAAIETLAQRLTAAIPEQQEVTLVHGDFHLSNIISSVDDGRVVAVVDWELCTLGDPLADVGGMLAYWPQADDTFDGPFMSSTLPGFPTRDEMTAEYAAKTGRSVEHVGFWHVLALWKLSIIAEGVLRRSQNNAGNVTGTTSTLIDDIVARAVATADEIGI